MNDKEQKLVGYIVYDIWTYRTKSPHDENWNHQVIIPEVHWKKKIYVNLSSAKEAARHLEGENRLAKAVIVPIYANREDLNRVKEGHKELKEKVDKINQTINERYNQIIDEVYERYWNTIETSEYDGIGPTSIKLPTLMKEQFINKCKSDNEFSEKWGLKIEERKLSLEERNDLLNKETNRNHKRENCFSDEEFERETLQDCKAFNIPTKLITLTYNNETVESYE